MYKIEAFHLDGVDNNFKTTPYWNWRASLTPGIALRLFGNTSIYIAPTLEVLHFELMPGITAGIFQRTPGVVSGARVLWI